MNSVTALAASSMSHNHPASVFSGGIDHLTSAHDLLPAKRISQPGFFHEIDVAAEKDFQFIDHGDPLEQTPRSIIREPDDNIDIAVRRKVIAQNGTKQRELRHSPFAAKI